MSGKPGLLEHAREQALDHVDQVVLLDERHLDVELRELGLAVRAQVLVAEAARDLVVALEAGDHQQLLEQLRRLRQRVERALVHAARDEEVARALGRRAGEDRRLDVEEVVRVEVVAHGADHLVAEHDGVVHALAAQVEHAMAQAQRLVHRAVLVDRERRRGRLRELLHIRDVDLDLARRHVRVDVARLAQDDLAGRADDVLGAQPLGHGVRLGRALGVEDELHEPGAVAQVDEDQAAVIAPPVHPAGHAHRLAGARRGQLAGPGVAEVVRPRRPHSPGWVMWWMTVSASTSRCSPVSMSLRATPSSPRMAT